MFKELNKERILIILTILIINLLTYARYDMSISYQAQAYERTIQRQAAQLRDKDFEIEIQQIVIETQDRIIDEYLITEPTAVPEHIGEFEITYYCPCTICCGPDAAGITASGTLATEGQTVAADWDKLLPGTEIYIDGIGYRTVEDKGSMIKGNSIDVFMNSHQAALEGGRHMADVWIVEEE